MPDIPCEVPSTDDFRPLADSASAPFADCRLAEHTAGELASVQHAEQRERCLRLLRGLTPDLGDDVTQRSLDLALIAVEDRLERVQRENGR